MQERSIGWFLQLLRGGGGDKGVLESLEKLRTQRIQYLGHGHPSVQGTGTISHLQRQKTWCFNNQSVIELDCTTTELTVEQPSVSREQQS
jgi:hypothetical protein